MNEREKQEWRERWEWVRAHPWQTATGVLSLVVMVMAIVMQYR